MLRDISPDRNNALTPDEKLNLTLTENSKESVDGSLDELSNLYSSLSDSESSRILFGDQTSLVQVGTEASFISVAKDFKDDQVVNSSRTATQTATIKAMRNANNHFSSLPLVALIIVLLLPINDFLRGVLACLFFVMTLENILICLGIFVDRFFLTFKTQRVPFTRPDYYQMPNIEVPAVKEQSTYKRYEGWMNEIDVYDVETYHVGMTRPVHLKLEGSILEVFNTNDYVKRRVLFGDKPIDLKTITFTNKRVYNLFGCRVELLPFGLPRRRSSNYWSNEYKKYRDHVKTILSGKQKKLSNASKKLSLKSSRLSVHKKKTLSEQHDKGLKKLSSLKLLVTENASDRKITSREKSVEFSREHKVESLSLSEDQSAREETFDSEGGRHQEDVHKYKEIGTQSSSIDFTGRDNLDEKYKYENVKNNSIEKIEKTFELDKKTSSIESFAQDEVVKSMVKQETSSGTDVVSINTNLPALRKLNPDPDVISSSDEIHILLFARVAREKEEFRRFVAASEGDNRDRDLNLSNIRDMGEEDVKLASAAADTLANPHHIQFKQQQKQKTAERVQFAEQSKKSLERLYDESIEGLIMYDSAARCDPQYLQFMATIQKACTQERIPIFKETVVKEHHDKRRKRSIRQENILWKGIDQSLFLGPSGSVVWANVLIGRVMYGALQNEEVLKKIKFFLQKKINQVKLPSFIESVSVETVDVGKTPPLIHRFSQPVIDESGVWVDADITYEGRFHLTIITKIDMKRIKRERKPTHVLVEVNPNVKSRTSHAFLTARSDLDGINDPQEEHELRFDAISQSSTVYESDLEISRSSSAESFVIVSKKEPDSRSQDDHLAEEECKEIGKDTTAVTANQVDKTSDNKAIPPARRRLRGFVDRIAALDLIQIATDNPYIQRAMEKMHTTINLDLDIKGIIGRIALNIPPPPSDRIWIGFRAPPRVWLSAHPSVGETSVDWALVTNVIESKICEAITQFFVYPNMEDLCIPVMGEPASETFKEYEIPFL
uniref:SMP-LTD domain-containing protein n=1 Tax=Glossina pallidipes TaxID=7398 RepID=A0A1A9ZTR2_GLOPL